MSQSTSTRAHWESAGTPEIWVRAYRDLAALDAIADAWDGLVLEYPGRLPTMSHAWLSAHLDLRHPEEQPWLCLGAFAGEQLVGVLSMALHQVTALGKTVVSLRQPGDAHTRSVDMVIAPGWEQAVVEAFRTALDEEVPDWFELEMTAIDGASPLLERANNGGIRETSLVVLPAGLATVKSTVGTWDEFFENSSGHFRKHFRQYGKKLAKLGPVEAEFLSGVEASPELLGRFSVLEKAGWKGRAGSAIGADERLTEFYRAVCARLHSRRALEWHFLKVGDTYVAGHFAIRTGRTLVLWKIGYDEAYAECSPGFLLIGEMMKRAFADPDTEAVNFVTDRTWLSSWRPEKHPYYDVWMYPRRVRSMVAGAWPKAARHRLKSIPGLKRAVRTVKGLVGSSS